MLKFNAAKFFQVRTRLSALPIVLLLTLLPLSMARAVDGVPESLQPWQQWLLHSQPMHACPWRLSQSAERICQWPGRLQLRVNGDGLQFQFRIDSYREDAPVFLPGNARHWPSEVMLDGRAAVVLEQQGRPYLLLDAGSHRVEGRMRWRNRPAQITVPAEIALVSLSLDGRDVAVDRRGNRILLSADTARPQNGQRDSLAVRVYRRFQDAVPQELETRIELSVSGKPRELSLGPALLPGQQFSALVSPLPARLEGDGSLRVQVRPGEFSLRLQARYDTDTESIALPPVSGSWPELEYFSFSRDTTLRQFRISGANSVDTSQIQLPPEWRELPTYRLDRETRLQLTTEFRGDHSPSANQLQQQRQLWLDFNGKGMTARDRISGRMSQEWRLNTAFDFDLGRATVDGQAVLITQDAEREGIEIRSGAINVDAVGRIDNIDGFSAVGWSARADQWSATLNLPPGWRLLHVAGIDSVSGSWISGWDLWDIFLLLIIVAVSRKMLGMKVAVLAGLSFLIAMHERSSPVFYLPALLILLALLPISSGRMFSVLRSASLVFIALFVLSTLGFAVEQFRLAIYPSLEMRHHSVASIMEPENYSMSDADVEEVVVTGSRLADMAEPVAQALQKAPTVKTYQANMAQRPRQLYQLRDGDRVQTGPGLPGWTWRAVSLRSSGPVTAEQQLQLWSLSPFWTSLWRIFSVLLSAGFGTILIMRLLPLLRFKAEAVPQAGAAMAVLAVLLMSTAAPPVAYAEDFPPRHLLDEWQRRLAESPRCLPHCVSLNNAELSIDAQRLRLRFDAHAHVDVALPLPAGGSAWRQREVLVDGKPAPIRIQSGALTLMLESGRHRVSIEGEVGADAIALNFPVPMHNVTARADGWTVEGLVDGRIVNQSLSLRSKQQAQAEEQSGLKQAPAQPFVRVSRRIEFDKQWQVHTVVERLAPDQGGFAVRIPLLEGEQVLTEAGRIVDGHMLLQFGHSQRRTNWSAAMEPVGLLQLHAPESDVSIESWHLLPSSLWRVQYEGIPAVKNDAAGAGYAPQFKPWPGESLQVQVSRPAGVEGPTHTVERASLSVEAGAQIQRSELGITVRASIGEDFVLRLPEDAELLHLRSDGRDLNLPPERELKIPLKPGEQRLELGFQRYGAMGWVEQTPLLDIQARSVNIDLRYRLPRDRWPLWISGPAIGPAMLFWGVLLVIVAAAVCLPVLARRLQLSMPLGFGAWLLLGLGLSTVNAYGVLVVALMFFALAARRQYLVREHCKRWQFNGLQLALGLWIVIAVFSLLAAIPSGLLSSPNMQISGNGSSSFLFRYFQDISAPGALPQITVISVPLWVYRVAMLLWSLWLAFRLIGWAKWVWESFSSGGSWQGKPSKIVSAETGE